MSEGAAMRDEGEVEAGAAPTSEAASEEGRASDEGGSPPARSARRRKRSAEPMRWELLLTCEHGGYEVPPPYRALFAGQGEVLASHRGWDPGALELSKALAKATGASLYHARTTRLLCDLNRSYGHRQLFSEFTRALSRGERESILEEHYWPYRESVQEHVADRRERGVGVLHIGVHTFTPVLGGEVRRADVGLLYDPAHALEAAICRRWRDALLAAEPRLVTRMNYPYRGVADGLPATLRKLWERDGAYLGLELEVNHALATGAVAPEPKAAGNGAAKLRLLPCACRPRGPARPGWRHVIAAVVESVQGLTAALSGDLARSARAARSARSHRGG